MTTRAKKMKKKMQKTAKKMKGKKDQQNFTSKQKIKRNPKEISNSKSSIPIEHENHTIGEQFLALYEDCLVGHQKPRRVYIQKGVKQCTQHLAIILVHSEHSKKKQKKKK